MTETPENRLRDLRVAQGLEQADLAEEFDVSTRTIGRWERDGIPAHAQRAVARRFSVSVSHLLYDDMDVAA